MPLRVMSLRPTLHLNFNPDWTKMWVEITIERQEQAVSSPKKPPRRKYPINYERFIPIAIVLLAAAIVLLLVIIVSVALGWTPG